MSILVDVAGQLAIVLASARARELRAPRRARPAQPRRDPPGRQPLRRALPRSAEPRRRHRRADARPRRGHGRHERVRLRERQIRRPVDAHPPARRLGVGPEQFDGRRPAARPSSILPPTSLAGPRCSAAAMSSAATSVTCPRTSAKRSHSQARSRFSRCRSSSRVGGGASSASRTPNTSATGASPRPRRFEQPPGSSQLRSRVSRPRATCVAATPCSKPSVTARERLVAAPNWRDAAPGFLQELGEASGASRSYLFENSVREDGRLIASQRFEWADDTTAPQLANPVMQDMCFEEVGLERVAELGARNELFTGQGEGPACRRAEFFEEQAIKSLMTVPIFVGGDVVGLHRLRRLRDGARVEHCRGRRSANELQPDRRRDRARALRGDYCASRSRSCAPSSTRHSTRSSSPTTTGATST